MATGFIFTYMHINIYLYCGVVWCGKGGIGGARDGGGEGEEEERK